MTRNDLLDWALEDSVHPVLERAISLGDIPGASRIFGASRIESKARSLATAIRSAASSLESSAQSTLNKTNNLRASAPRGISLGTQRFCVESVNGTNTCHQIPVDIIKSLSAPGFVTTLFKDEIAKLQNLQDSIAGSVLAINRLLDALILVTLAYMVFFICLTCIKRWREQNGRENNFARLKMWSSLALVGVEVLILAYPVAFLWIVDGRIRGLFTPSVRKVIQYAGGPVKSYLLSCFVLFVLSAIPTYFAFWARQRMNNLGSQRTEGSQLIKNDPSLPSSPTVFARPASPRSFTESKLRISAPIREEPQRPSRSAASVFKVAKEAPL